MVFIDNALFPLKSFLVGDLVLDSLDLIHLDILFCFIHGFHRLSSSCVPYLNVAYQSHG